jgi:hypothetical protein
MRPWPRAQNSHQFSPPHPLRHDPKAKPDICGIGDPLHPRDGSLPKDQDREASSRAFALSQYRTAASGSPFGCTELPVVADSCLMGLPIADSSKTREVSVNVSYWAGFGDHE